ncbi:phage antirepressor KilAC domain-containing protein [uncultured Sneathia sp.]|uniref:phage antirepressor KilAC domain-containing protein n=1 Tax=uncultured Sneathia sp. TaxID=278067 RepID=UPI002591FDD1|nr:phage antirepressor KilAC domain-containing protein [uncultured Sneathia sp.]
MNELIKIETNENLEPIISLRELYNKLEITERYSNWTDRMFKYGFTENVDYTGCKVFNTLANQELQDHAIKLDMAKEICMLQRNEKGKQFRKYFIQVEKDFNSPEKIMARAVLIANKKVSTLTIEVKELKNKIEEDRPRVSFAETIEKSSDSILIREFSKILANENIHIGQNKLYSLLRQWGYIFQNSTEPTQKAVQQGLFKINERVIKSVKGDILSRTTMVTGKGQVFLLDKIKRMELN